MKITSGIEKMYAVKEMHEAKKLVAETDEISKALQENSTLGFNVFSEIDPTVREAKEAVVNDTAKLRSPEVLNTRLATKLYDEGITPDAWKNASNVERKKMIEKTFDTMIEQMQVPKEIRNCLQLKYMNPQGLYGGMHVAGRCERFVGLDQNGKLAVTETPIVRINEGLVHQEFDTALGSLFYQAIKVMQQATCVEPAGTYCDPVEQAKWAAEVMDQINGKIADISDMNCFAGKAEKEMLAKYHFVERQKGIAGSRISFGSSNPSAI